ncbi:acyltransferase [Spirochaetia bacterium]|nr:acyltransferase [Spirochaetia bacterium]
MHYANYAFPALAFGGFGVDIFFIISGFIIAFMVSKNTDNFIIKRIIRIVPLYWIATFITILLAVIFPKWFNNTTIEFSAIIKSLLFIPYKIGSSGPVILAGWTLNCEMLFYLVMGLCICFVKNKKYLTITCISILVVFIIVLNVINSDIYIFQFYQTQGLFSEFIYGIVLYHIYTFFNRHINKKGYNQNSKDTIKIISLALLAVFSFLFLIFGNKWGIKISVNRNIQTGIPALMLVIALLFFEKYINGNNSIVKFGVKLGDASYAMYLFHPFFIYFFQRLIFPRLIGNNGNLIIEVLKLLISLTITTIGSIFIYKFIDNSIQIQLKKYFKKIKLIK